MSEILERVLEKMNTAAKIIGQKAVCKVTNVTADVVVGIDKEVSEQQLNHLEKGINVEFDSPFVKKVNELNLKYMFFDGETCFCFTKTLGEHVTSKDFFELKVLEKYHYYSKLVEYIKYNAENYPKYLEEYDAILAELDKAIESGIHNHSINYLRKEKRLLLDRKLKVPVELVVEIEHYNSQYSDYFFTSDIVKVLEENEK